MTPAEVDRVRAQWLDAQRRRDTRAETAVALIVGTALVLSALIALLMGLAIAAGLVWFISWVGGQVA